MTSSASTIGQSNGSNGLSEAFRVRGSDTGISFDDLLKQLSDKNSPITKAIERAGNDAPFLKGLDVNVEDGINKSEAEKIAGKLEQLQPEGDANKDKLSFEEFANALLGSGKAPSSQPAGGAPAPSSMPPAPAGAEAPASADQSQVDQKIEAAAEELGMEPEELEKLLDKDRNGEVSEAEFKPLEDLFDEEFFADMNGDTDIRNDNSQMKMLA